MIQNLLLERVVLQEKTKLGRLVLMSIIKMEKHFNMNVIAMESKVLKVKLLPDIGFKMVSLEYKPKKKEFIFQPLNKKYEIPFYGDDFEKYDTSGLDEMIPTIAKCIYPEGLYKGSILPNHGDVWSIPWSVNCIDNTVKGKVTLKSLPLEFFKELTFQEENLLRIDYKVKNLSSKNISFLWALHGLNIFDDETKLILPNEENRIINVHENDVLGCIGQVNTFPFAKDINGATIDLTLFKSYKDNRSYKYYFLNPVKNGEVGLQYVKDNIMYLIKYDAEKIPYLGVWITKGGFKGEYNCAIEPSNGFYDSLELAFKNKRLKKLNPFEKTSWTIFIEVKDNKKINN